MAFGNTLGMIALGQSISAGTCSPPKRKRGRPRKWKGTALAGSFKLRRPRGKPRQYDSVEVLRVVDEYKTCAWSEGRRLSDARAIGELLHRLAPPATRQEIDRLFKSYQRQAETKFQEQWGALRKAIVQIEGSRFATLKDLVAEARRQKRSAK